MLTRSLAVLMSLALLAPSLAFAQQPRAGVVTTLEGNVTARRVALPDPVPLKFKDEVFLQDTVTTGDKSLARMLLGGKAVVTVRERSMLTITEVPGRSTIELESGKFAMAVARERMRPGEEILIRTPNAIAGVRGTVVVTEVNRQGAQVGGTPAVVTNFYVLRGDITAQPLDPATRTPVGTPLQIGTLQAYSGAGVAVPRVTPVPADQLGQITAGLQPSGPKGGGDAGKEQVKSQAVQTAVSLLAALHGGPGSAPGAHAPVAALAHRPHAPLLPPVGKEKDGEAIKDLIAQLQALLHLIQTIVGDVVVLTGPAVRLTGPLTSPSTAPLIQLTDTTVIQFGNDVSLVEVLKGANVTLAGPLLKSVNSTVATTGSLLTINGGKLKSTSAAPFVTLESSFITTNETLMTMNGGSLILAGPLLLDTNGTILAGQEFLRMRSGATLTSTGAGALIELNGTRVGGAAALSMTDSIMTLAGSLVSLSGVTGVGGDSGTSASLFGLRGSTITSTGTSPLFSLTSTEADPGGSFLRLLNGSTITLAGPLFAATGGELGSGLPTSLAAFISLLDGSRITSTSTSPLIAMTGVTFDAQGPLFNARRSLSVSAPTKVSLAGPLFSAHNTTINTTSLGFGSTFGTAPRSCCSTFALEQGATLTSSTSAALIGLTNSTVTVADAQSGGNFFFVTDSVDGFPSSELVAPSAVSLAGPLLSATGSTIKPLFALLHVNRSTLTSTTTSPLIGLTNSTVTVGGNDISGTPTPFARMLTLISSPTQGTAASPASISLAGPLMSASGSTLRAVQFMGVFNGASFTSMTTDPLVSLNNASLTLTTVGQERGHFLSIGGQGSTSGSTFATMNLSGPLLSVNNGSALTLSGGLVNVFPGGQIVETHPTSAFMSITGGTHSIGTTSSVPLLDLNGQATSSETISTPGLATTESTLTLGTDQPLQRSGSGAVLELSGATVSAHKGLELDKALLSASAPLISLKNGASLTSATDALNLAQKAKLTTTGPVVKLDGSTLTVTSGHLLNVLNGSFLNVNGDLFTLANSSTVTISNGGALVIRGNSVVKITGGFINFTGAGGNVFNITNSITPQGSCSPQCGIQFDGKVAFINGATQTNVSISNNAIKNTGLGTFNLSAGGSAIVLDGPNAKLIVNGL